MLIQEPIRELDGGPQRQRHDREVAETNAGEEEARSDRASPEEVLLLLPFQRGHDELSAVVKDERGGNNEPTEKRHVQDRQEGSGRIEVIQLDIDAGLFDRTLQNPS